MLNIQNDGQGLPVQTTASPDFQVLPGKQSGRPRGEDLSSPQHKLMAISPGFVSGPRAHNRHHSLYLFPIL